MGRPLENLAAVRTYPSAEHLALISPKLHSLRSHPATFHLFPNALTPRIMQIFPWNTLISPHFQHRP